MNDEQITIEYIDDGIAELNMNDRDNNNTFTPDFVELFLDNLDLLKNKGGLKVLIISGMKEIFCAGADKASLLKIKSNDIRVKDLVLSEKLLDLPFPVISLMEGHALGGGFVLGLCGDMILMDEKSNYGVNFIRLGFTPGMGCTRLLQGLVGEYIANEMMFTGKTFRGKHFSGKSLVNYILPKDALRDKALNLAKDIACKPLKTVEILKYSLTLKKKQLLAEARTFEDLMHTISFSQDEVLKIIEENYNE
jgi:polyketide biosynthesis enoyl-CoA hydratase PksI